MLVHSARCTFARKPLATSLNPIQIFLVTALLPLLCSCRFLPYKVEEIDYKSDQAKAAILIGDPQVYARASLINDRRDETEYLKQLLANSKVKDDGTSTVKFSPQILRDLKTVDVLSASLGLSVGKSDRTSATDLNDQIQVAKLKAQLAVLQKQIEGIETAKPPDVMVPAPDLSKDLTATAQGSEAHVLTPDVSKLQNAIGSIQTQLATLASTGTSAPTAPSNNYGGLADPRDDLLDRQAYRRDVRAALAEAQLDDTHDRGGNALYRLQFQATVLPPDGKTQQWGAARLQIFGPGLTRAEIVSKYYNWLSHITSTLSDTVEARDIATGVRRGHNYDYDRYVGQIGAPDYFTVADIFVEDKSGDYYCFGRSGATTSKLQEIDNDTSSKGAGLKAIPTHAPGIAPRAEHYTKIGTYAAPPDVIDPIQKCSSYSSGDANGKYYEISRPPINQETRFLLGQITREASLRLGVITLQGAYAAQTTDSDRVQHVPAAFCIAITEPPNVAQCDFNSYLRALHAAPAERDVALNEKLPAAGSLPTKDDYSVKSYSVLPGELAQRLGVTTEASQSLQTALTVAAQLSASTSGSLDIGYLSQADARAEALARQPIVVGFAGTEAAPAGNSGVAADVGYFGWLFGPQFAVKDTKTLSLRQAVRGYGVNADVSVPGWWSSLELHVDTAWIHNWRQAELLEHDDKGTITASIKKRVNLPLVDAAYDSLTDFIAAKRFGPQNSRIFASSVVPDVVSSCSSLVSFQINGTNIWRANSALLGGVPAKTITVLPDMNGITAQFEPPRLSRRPHNLRGWGNGNIKAVFSGSSGACSADGGGAPA